MTLNQEVSKSPNSLIAEFDGSGREPRPLQVEALAWIAERLGSKPLVIQAPTGVGKSGIARAVQREFGGAIIVPQNVLLDQYVTTYPDVNALKGQECYPPDLVQYEANKQRVLDSEPTIFNPLSLYYARVAYDVNIVDEAHKLPEMLELLTSSELSYSRWMYPGTSKAALIPWFEGMSKSCAKAGGHYKGLGDTKSAVERFAKAATFKELAQQFTSNPTHYVTYEEQRKLTTKTERYLIIRPVTVPDKFYRMVRSTPNTILTSATIPRTRAREILGTDNFHYLDLNSPIPKEQRPVLFRPSGLTSKSTAADIAHWVKKQRSEFSGNTILHTTYQMGKQLHKYFPDALIHTPETKAATLERFKRDGGLWIAAGCSEGIDLPNDECRLNLIPVLPFSSIGDVVTKARMSLPGGNANYVLNTMIATVQSVGRSTRGEQDHSITVIGDDRLARSIGTVKNQLPKSFLEAIKWNGQLS